MSDKIGKIRSICAMMNVLDSEIDKITRIKETIDDSNIKHEINVVLNEYNKMINHIDHDIVKVIEMFRDRIHNILIRINN